MERKLPLYIFIRNSIIIFLLFLLVSILIIEHRKQMHGEDSLFSKKENFKTTQISSEKSALNLPRNYIIY